MTLHQLRVFHAVARTRNISRASKELHISQPTVSWHLKQLEFELGCRLYRVVKNRIKLTIDGEVLQREAKSLLAQVDQLLATFKKKIESNRATEELRIGTTLGAKISFVASTVGAFLKDSPRVRASIVEGFSPDLESKILNFELDVALVNNLGHLDDLRYESLGKKIEIVPFVSSRHPLARKTTVSLEDILRAPLILRRREDGLDSRTERFLRNLAPSSRNLKVVLYTDSYDALILAVRQRLGVGFTHRDRLKRGVGSRRYKILEVPGFTLASDTYFVSAKAKPLSSVATKFREFLLSRLGRNSKAPITGKR